MTIQPPISAQELNEEQTTILVSLPLMVLGLFLMFFALISAPFPPNYINAPLTETVSHWERMTGNDVPEPLTPDSPVPAIQRPPNYDLRRGVDGMAYLAVVQGVVAIIGLIWLHDKNLYLLLIVTGFYGAIYSAFLGLVLGPIILAFGSLLVLCGALLSWLTIPNFFTRAAGRTASRSSS